SDHTGDKKNRRSRTGFVIFINGGIIDWLLKKQSTIESSVFGAEFCALKHCIKNLHRIRYKLRMMGYQLMVHPKFLETTCLLLPMQASLSRHSRSQILFVTMQYVRLLSWVKPLSPKSVPLITLLTFSPRMMYDVFPYLDKAQGSDRQVLSVVRYPSHALLMGFCGYHATGILHLNKLDTSTGVAPLQSPPTPSG
ncbi:hypothetical protein ACHAXN_000044, partial [Cyclotella atomus]